MQDISQLHPRARDLANALVAACARQGITIKIGECLRTVEEQDALYAQGRTKPGSIVTNCKGSTYSSMHQWGVAFDFFLRMDVDGDGSVSDDAFNNSTGLFEKVGVIGQALGLEWGGSWKSIKDRPHFQLPDWGSTASKLKSQYGTFERFKATWPKSGTTAATPAPAPSSPSTNKGTGSGTITADSGVNVRSGPGTSAGKVGALAKGTKVSIIKLSAATAEGLLWAKVSYGNISGYIAQKYLAVDTYPTNTDLNYSKNTGVESAAKKDAALAGTYKTTANLNLRMGAGTNKDVIITIPKGSSVQNYGYYTDVGGTTWMFLAYGKYTGFASKGYLSKVK